MSRIMDCELITVNSVVIPNVGSGIMYIQFKVRNHENMDMETLTALIVLDKEKTFFKNNTEVDYTEMEEQFKSSELFDLLYTAFKIHGEEYVYNVSTYFPETIIVIDSNDEQISYNYEKFKKEMIDKGSTKNSIKVKSEIFTTLQYGDTLEVMHVFRDMENNSIFTICSNIEEETRRFVEERKYQLTDKEKISLAVDGLMSRNRELFEMIVEKCNDESNNQQFEYVYETGKVLVYTESEED